MNVISLDARKRDKPTEAVVEQMYSDHDLPPEISDIVYQIYDLAASNGVDTTTREFKMQAGSIALAVRGIANAG